MRQIDAENIVAIIKNVRRLQRDASLLAKHDRWQSSIALSIFALEEIGKLLLIFPAFGEPRSFVLKASSQLHSEKLNRLKSQVWNVAWTIAAAEHHGISIKRMLEINAERQRRTGQWGDGLSTDVNEPNVKDDEPLDKRKSVAIEAILNNEFVKAAVGIFILQHSGHFTTVRKLALYEDIERNKKSDPFLPPLDKKLANRLLDFIRKTLTAVRIFMNAKPV